MKLDLFKIYKAFYQRHYREPDDELKKRIKDLAESLVRGKKSHEELLVIAEQIQALELRMPRVQKYFSSSLLTALKSRNYEINVPHEIAHGWTERGISGYIYIGVSHAKADQIKIGACTISLADRVKAYKEKFGYPLDIARWWFVHEPFLFESAIAKRLRNCRVSANTSGDSNEWYWGKVSDVEKIVASIMTHQQISRKLEVFPR